MLPAGAVAPAFQLFDAVSGSVLDLGYGTGGYGYGKHRAFALMAAVPFGFTVRDHLAFRQRTDTKAAFDELITGILKLNVVALPCGAFGRSGEFWLNRPLQLKSDLVGKKLRFAGLSADIYAKLGSAVNVLPGGEIIPAIERGPDRAAMPLASIFSPPNLGRNGWRSYASSYPKRSWLLSWLTQAQSPRPFSQGKSWPPRNRAVSEF